MNPRMSRGLGQTEWKNRPTSGGASKFLIERYIVLRYAPRVDADVGAAGRSRLQAVVAGVVDVEVPATSAMPGGSTAMVGCCRKEPCDVATRSAHHRLAGYA